MNLSIKDYANEVPEEIRWLLKGFADDNSLGLLIALMKNGKMSFNEIKEQFDLSPSSLTKKLNVLQDGNLIQNFYEKTDGRSFSYYDVTDIPEQIFDSIYEILYTPSKEQTRTIEIKGKSVLTTPSSEKEETEKTFYRQKLQWGEINTSTSNDFVEVSDIGS